MAKHSGFVVGASARAPRIVGAALAATTGLLALYAGNPRLPRAYAAACTVTNTNTAGAGSLPKALQDAQAGTCDTITISATGTLTLTADLPTIDFQTTSITSLTINSNTGFTIDGNNNYDGLDVTALTNVSRKDVSLTDLRVLEARNSFVADLTIAGSYFADVKASADGGAVYANGDASVTDSTFTNNISSGNYGGALYVSGKATIDGSTFEGNQIDEYGGALYAKGGVTITGSNFFTNHVDLTNGGAITTGEYTVVDSISGSKFYGNTSGGTGGALFSGKGASGSTITIAGSTFKDNEADGTAGAVYAKGSVTITSGSTFRNNTSYNEGGAVYSTYAATITDSTFTGNTAGDSGGAVYADDVTNITNSTFTGNTSTGDSGGAVHTDGTTAITGSTFTNNNADVAGGGVYAKANTTITSSSFTGNATTSEDDGGAVYIYYGATVTNSTFTNNTSAEDGGALYALEEATITGSTFTGNTSAEDGGALYANKGGTIVNSTFTGNTAGDSGGAVHVWDASLSLQFSTLSGNTAVTGNSLYFTSSAEGMTTQGSVLSSPGGGNCAFGGVITKSAQSTVVGNTAGNDTSCGLPSLGGIQLATTAAINLGPLANNGGPTRTMRPGDDSVLIGAAPDALGTGITTDQRGATRTAPFTVGSVQVNVGPSSLNVRWVPWNIMSKWSPIPAASKYQNTLTLRPRAGTPTTRTAIVTGTQWQWPVKPAPGTAYTICVKAYYAGVWSAKTCKSSTVGTIGWRGAGKALPTLRGTVHAPIR